MVAAVLLAHIELVCSTCTLLGRFSQSQYSWLILKSKRVGKPLKVVLLPGFHQIWPDFYHFGNGTSNLVNGFPLFDTFARAEQEVLLRLLSTCPGSLIIRPLPVDKTEEYLETWLRNKTCGVAWGISRSEEPPESYIMPACSLVLC